MIQIIGNLFGCVVNFAASEESLAVGFLIKNDTETSSHVNNLSIRVEVNILSAILAPVSINVLKLVGFIWW